MDPDPPEKSKRGEELKGGDEQFLGGSLDCFSAKCFLEEDKFLRVIKFAYVSLIKEKNILFIQYFFFVKMNFL